MTRATKHVATVDADGVALAALQGPNEKVEVRSEREGQKSEVRIQKLEEENAELKACLTVMEELILKLKTKED